MKAKSLLVLAITFMAMLAQGKKGRMEQMLYGNPIDTVTSKVYMDI